MTSGFVEQSKAFLGFGLEFLNGRTVDIPFIPQTNSELRTFTRTQSDLGLEAVANAIGVCLDFESSGVKDIVGSDVVREIVPDIKVTPFGSRGVVCRESENNAGVGWHGSVSLGMHVCGDCERERKRQEAV